MESMEGCLSVCLTTLSLGTQARRVSGMVPWKELPEVALWVLPWSFWIEEEMRVAEDAARFNIFVYSHKIAK